MKLTLTEYTVLLDTLMGSLRIADGGMYWKFDGLVRSQLVESLLRRMDGVEIEVAE